MDAVSYSHFLSVLAHLSKLRRLSLRDTGTNGSGLMHLPNKNILISLNLSETSIGDEDDSHLDDFIPDVSADVSVPGII